MKTGAIRGLLVIGVMGATLGAAVLNGITPAFASTNDPSCFVAAINAARGSDGVGALATNPALAVIAQAWSGSMAAAGQISHNLNLPNVAPSTWMALGENVGVGPSCDALAQAFMNSPEHKANILNPAYSSVGVGVVITADGTVYVTEDFMGTANPAPAAVHTTPPAPAPVHTTNPAPAAVHTTPPAPAPVHTTSPVPAAVHTVVPAPAPVPTKTSPPPSVTVTPPVLAPAANPMPVPVVTPAAEPIVLPEASVPPSPADANLTRLTTNANHGHHHHGGVLQAIGSLLAHLF